LLERVLISQPLTELAVHEFWDLKPGADLAIGATGVSWSARFVLGVLAPAQATYARQNVATRKHECKEQDKPPAALGFHVGVFSFCLTENYC